MSLRDPKRTLAIAVFLLVAAGCSLRRVSRGNPSADVPGGPVVEVSDASSSPAGVIPAIHPADLRVDPFSNPKLSPKPALPKPLAMSSNQIPENVFRRRRTGHSPRHGAVALESLDGQTLVLGATVHGRKVEVETASLISDFSLVRALLRRGLNRGADSGLIITVTPLVPKRGKQLK